MRRIQTIVLPVVVLVLAATQVQAYAAVYEGYVYPPGAVGYVPSDLMSRVDRILSTIDHPARRRELAEDWLKFAKTAISRNQAFQREWLDTQKLQISRNEQAHRQQLRVAELHLEIEQLRARNLQLERENLQLQAQLRGRTAEPPSDQPADREPQESAR